jgi:hypothetical protein
MTNIEALQLVLRTYRFETPVPEDVRRFILKSSKRNLIVILKKFGKCGFVMLGAIHVLYFVKKFGFSLSMTKAYILFIAGSAFIAGAVTTVSVVTAKKIIEKKTPGIIQPVESITPAATGDSPQPGSAVKADDTQKEKPVSQLKKLYNTYKHVEKVHLKDGTILSGVVHERANGVDLITPEGTLNLSKDDIQSVEYLSPEKL